MYAPLETYSGLFMTLAETKTDADSIFQFAEKYGLLFEVGGPVPLEAWRNEINKMKKTVDFWQAKKAIGVVLASIEHNLNVHLEFIRDDRELVLAPNNTLIDALWLQFALAVSENKIFRHCTWCNTPFHAKGKQVKAERVFCSNSCKSLDYRHRKEHAAKKER